MAFPDPIPETTLYLSRTFPARREEVFRAWTDPKAMTRWFAPSDDFEVRVPTLELQPGGRYRVEMRLPERTHVAVGEYREVSTPEKLVFTWRWENEPAMSVGDTLVTVEFFERGDSTELVLIQERFPSAKDRDDHNEGWSGALDRLGRFLSERSSS